MGRRMGMGRLIRMASEIVIEHVRKQEVSWIPMEGIACGIWIMMAHGTDGSCRAAESFVVCMA